MPKPRAISWPIYPRLQCGCPTYKGRTISDPDRHAEFHALVLRQGGPPGEVDTSTLRRRRRTS